MVGQPLGDEPGVIGDVGAVPGVQALERHRGRPPQALQVLDARAGARAGGLQRRVDLGVGGDLGQQMVADERDPLALVHEQRVGGAVPGAGDDAQVAAAGADVLAVRQHDVRGVGIGLAAQELPERLGVGDHRLRDAVVAHEREREAPVGLAALLGVRAVGGRALVGGDARARARGDRRREAAVVQVMVRDQHQLEVLEPHAGAAQAGLERGQRRVVARARVDQRQRRRPAAARR